MTRPSAIGSGLRSNHEHPYEDLLTPQAAEHGNALILYEDEVLVLDYTPTRSGGATKDDWTPRASRIAGRLDPVGSGGRAGGLRGDVIEESATHIVTVGVGNGIDTQDRFEVHGNDWLITAQRERTDPTIDRYEVKRA